MGRGETPSQATQMMEPNQDTEGAPGRQWPGSIRSRVDTGWQRLRRIAAFRPRRLLVGLDIGSEKMKAVVLHRPHGRVTLQQAAIASIPASALTDGVFTASITVAAHLRSMLQTFGIRQRNVAVAAAGAKVFLRPEVVPEDRDGDLLSFAREAAQKVLPYSIDSAALDYEPVETPAGAPRQIIWAGTMTEQVEWLREAVTLAGKTPFIVDVEACALANAFVHSAEPKPDQTSLLVHIGAHSLNMCLLRGKTLLASHQATEDLNRLPVKLESLPDPVAAALEGSWELLKKTAEPDGIDQIYLSGGRAREKMMGENLAHRFGLPVQELDPFRNVSYSPSSDAGRLICEHAPAFTVAVGLALRSFEDL